MRLAHKVILLTGACGGIGRAAARRFVDEGATLVLVDIDPSALAEAAAALGPAASHVAADVADPGQMERAVRFAVERHGGIDVFVANAGIEGAVERIEDYPLEDFERVYRVNVGGVFLGLKYAMPALRQRGGGSVIITSSAAGVSGIPKLSAYVASKHAVIGLMRSAALEGARHNIRVNTVNPGPVDLKRVKALVDQHVTYFWESVRKKGAKK